MGHAGIRSAYATGRGKLTLRGRAEIIENEKNNKTQIVITELPYTVNKARLIEHIADLVKDKRIDTISHIADHSDRDGMNIVIDLKRDANAQVTLNQLYSFSQLQSTEGVILLALDKGVPKIMTLKQMLQSYIDFQGQIITRRTQFELRKAKERAHILDGLLIAQDNIDEVVNIFRTSKSPAQAKERLIERFELSQEQAQAISEMTMSRLTGLEREKLEDELSKLRERITELEALLSDYTKILAMIKDELLEILQEYISDGQRSVLFSTHITTDLERVADFITFLSHGSVGAGLFARSVPGGGVQVAGDQDSCCG